MAIASVGLTYWPQSKALADDRIWGYGDNNGPKQWSQLTPQYALCQTGTRQSPIDLQAEATIEPITVEIHYQPTPLTILHTGQTIQLVVDNASYLSLDNRDYSLQQVHFHHPSEHTLFGKPFPMEMHFVHADAANHLVVLSVFLKEGPENIELRPIWRTMPSQKTPAQVISNVQVDLEHLLPQGRRCFRYDGSLTTPPCSEIVQWIIFQDAIAISSTQLKAFASLFPTNARSVQPLNQRSVLQSL
ncbi:carbonic anhydrase family protein [Oscillatoria sp. CS-180]|uniref:carbonic anhydrase n=1 Tax=Oscillatoria sp. CS-180 TaxID=3021720 RepID=UPI00232B64ED|nr:carbonic anhydrase family protein [Oscillatoria sp. CS-180]MDB9526749.1 carbonic anhydrase family protein [Oscillatoria sp. CS-180]